VVLSHDGADDGRRHKKAASRSYLQEIVAAFAGKGDTKLIFLEFPEADGSNGYGCDYHPSKAQHQAMANALVPVVKSTLGWN